MKGKLCLRCLLIVLRFYVFVSLHTVPLFISELLIMYETFFLSQRSQ